MSKKLIAVAAAAALALTGLVGVAPANASAPTITLKTVAGVTGGQTGADSDTANTVAVPSANALTVSGPAATADTLRAVDLGSIAVGDTVTVTTTGSVKVTPAELAASALYDVTTFGKTSYTETYTTTGTKQVFFFTTSTAVGSAAITVSRVGATVTKTFYFKGIAGLPYNLSVKGVPAALADTKKADVTIDVTDVFGNMVENVTFAADATTGTAAAPVLVVPASLTSKATANNLTGYWNATTKTHEGVLTSSTDGAFVVDVAIDHATTAGIQAGSVAGLAKASNRFQGVVNNPATSAQIATLTAQLAEATAKLAKRVTKKRFNTLARKWNAAFPSQKVKLKK